MALADWCLLVTLAANVWTAAMLTWVWRMRTKP
jgi:hypothetical protein